MKITVKSPGKKNTGRELFGCFIIHPNHNEICCKFREAYHINRTDCFGLTTSETDNLETLTMHRFKIHVKSLSAAIKRYLFAIIASMISPTGYKSRKHSRVIGSSAPRKIVCMSRDLRGSVVSTFGNMTPKLQNEIYRWAAKLQKSTVIKRHQQENCRSLLELDKTCELNDVPFSCPTKIRCYSCSSYFRRCHPVYVFCCRRCGDKFQKLRHKSRDLTDDVCLVIGARTKLGHQVVVKLLEAGATVVGTSRYPNEALHLYSTYPDWPIWRTRLYFYPAPLDLDSADILTSVERLVKFIQDTQDLQRLDVLVNCAAQTIRCREKRTGKMDDSAKNRYGDSAFVIKEKEPLVSTINSWNMRLVDLYQTEMEEVFRINAVAPCIMIQQCLPLLQLSSKSPYILNVHAREGLFGVEKNDKHIHTNMAKAGLAMLTKCLKSGKHKTSRGHPIFIHGIDPGWISIDEYYEDERPFIVPPLDEIDGAARVLYPVMAKIKGSFSKTRRHFFNFLH